VGRVGPPERADVSLDVALELVARVALIATVEELEVCISSISSTVSLIMSPQSRQPGKVLAGSSNTAGRRCRVIGDVELVGETSTPL